MHRPARPKSAKGKSRPTRNAQEAKNQFQNDSSSINRTPPAASPSCSSRSSSRQATITSAFANNTKRSVSSPLLASSPNIEASSPIGVFPELNRPTSSLSRYPILPSISGADGGFSGGGDQWLGVRGVDMDGRISEMDLLTEQAQQMLLDSSMHVNRKQPTPPRPSSSKNKRKVSKTSFTGETKRPKMYQTRSIFSSSHNSSVKEAPKPRVPKEPGPNEERILLALKLPDGTRVERYFNPHVRLIGVLAFAHSQYPILPVSQCNLFRMDVVPKKLLAQTDLSLQDVGIKNRTVLYVEEKDDD